MQLFDMHCDTLYRAYTEHSTLFNDSFHISFRKAADIRPYIQCLAVWIPDEYRGAAAWELFCGCVEKLKEQLKGTDIIWCRTADDLRRVKDEKGQGIILTAEGGAVLGGNLEKIAVMYDMGVRMMTLTWNGRNELGDGIMEKENRGLTPFGRAAVREMERVGMIVDVSHAGEALFWDVAAIAGKPFVASHSNIRAVTNHPRNLTDEQFYKLMKVGGLTGLNFCADFLDSKNSETPFPKILHQSGMYDIIKHTAYMLSLGGKDHIAMGADFDGAELPEDIRGIESMKVLYDLFAEHFGEDTADAVFFDNAFRFFSSRCFS